MTHLLQTRAWGELKARFGWEADNTASPLMLYRRLPLGLRLAYVPRGPKPTAAQLTALSTAARRRGAFMLKLEPDVEDTPDAVADLLALGLQPSPHAIQPRRSIVIDLAGSADDVLARMKQKTRYNVRLAEKKGVTVRVGNLADLPLLYKMYAETSVRDGFVIRDENYYMTVWKLFMSEESSSLVTHPSAIPLIAEVDNEPVAAIFLFMFAERGYYVYGMSRDKHREKMPTYLLQWAAMKHAKAHGCLTYDLWGAPDIFDESDSMWGVYRFKEGLGGEVVRTLGAYDFAPNKFWYSMYSDVMPRILDFMRSRGKEKTKQGLSA